MSRGAVDQAAAGARPGWQLAHAPVIELMDDVVGTRAHHDISIFALERTQQGPRVQAKVVGDEALKLIQSPMYLPGTAAFDPSMAFKIDFVPKRAGLHEGTLEVDILDDPKQHVSIPIRAWSRDPGAKKHAEVLAAEEQAKTDASNREASAAARADADARIARHDKEAVHHHHAGNLDQLDRKRELVAAKMLDLSGKRQNGITLASSNIGEFKRKQPIPEKPSLLGLLAWGALDMVTAGVARSVSGFLKAPLERALSTKVIDNHDDVPYPMEPSVTIVPASATLVGFIVEGVRTGVKGAVGAIKSAASSEPGADPDQVNGNNSMNAKADFISTQTDAVTGNEHTVATTTARYVHDSLLDTLDVAPKTAFAVMDTMIGGLDAAFSNAIAIGPEGAGRATLLGRAAGERGFGTLRVKALAAEPGARERQLRAIVREACLFELVPLFQEVDRETAVAIERATRGFAGPVLVTALETVPWRERPVVTHVVERPRGDARAEIWRACLPDADAGTIARAVASYELRPGAIVASARNAAVASSGHVTVEAIHAGVRAWIGDELGTLATRIDWRQTWEDLVLPPEQFEQIVELVARVRHRTTVLESWGFAAKVGKGHGVTALFSGPPGTGKTMVAGLVAKELGLDLYQVDLSKIVSKYIGETEKQLASLFDAAEAGHAVLLFDEADSLFAKRTEVKSSNDRYANLEVNFLLQRMESFTGISILTTNHETSIDEAFRRRLALHVRFPVPEEEQRAQLWRAMLPPKAPLAAGIELERLARELEMSGGYLKNAVLRAAYLAAEEGTAIGMTHLWKSARAEYDAMGKISIGSI